MKKVLFTVALVSATVLVSCSKQYNCHCVYKTNGEITNEMDNTISEGSKEESAASCDQMDASSTSSVGGTTYVNTTECSITE